MIHHISIATNRKKQVIDITSQVEDLLAQCETNEGVCTIFVQHTTACIVVTEIGEGTDADLLDVVEEIIPRIRFRHAHDPSHAWSHMASSIVGPSLSVPFSKRALLLGTWQRIACIELDGPRKRNVVVSIA